MKYRQSPSGACLRTPAQARSDLLHQDTDIKGFVQERIGSDTLGLPQLQLRGLSGCKSQPGRLCTLSGMMFGRCSSI